MCTQIAKICIFAKKSRARAMKILKFSRATCTHASEKFYKNFAKIFSLRVHVFLPKKAKISK